MLDIKTYTNPFLGEVMRRIRADRPPLPAHQHYFTRVEKVDGGVYVEIWFRTRGCTWDRSGGCTMCNYGAGEDVAGVDVVATVRAALDELDVEHHELMISPSGGMWDSREVPPSALPPIYDMVVEANPSLFLVETHADTITPDRLGQLREALPMMDLAVEVGLESAHDGVLAFAVNKGSFAANFCRAAARAADHGVKMYANVSLGTAMLDRRHAAWDALASTKWALANGADKVVIFPLHCKPYTMLDVLHRHGRFERVCLWDLVEVLEALGPEATTRTEIAWYRSYYDDVGKVTVSPGSCDRCIGELLDGLDRYRATQDHSAIGSLHARRCPCAGPRLLDEGGVELDGDATAESILEHYAVLAEILDLEHSWLRHGPRLHGAVRRAFARYAEFLRQEVHGVG